MYACFLVYVHVCKLPQACSYVCECVRLRFSSVYVCAAYCIFISDTVDRAESCTREISAKCWVQVQSL